MASPTTRRAAFLLCAALATIPVVPLAHAQGTSSFNGMTLQVTPDVLTVGVTNNVNVHLWGSNGANLVGKQVRLCGPGLDSGFPSTPPANLSQHGGSCPHFEATRADGVAPLRVRPFTTANVFVYVDDLYASRVLPVTAGALQVAVSPSSPKTNEQVTLTVSLPDGSTPSGSLVNVSRSGARLYTNMSTDSSGRISLGYLSAGAYEVRARRSNYIDSDLTFLVEDPPRADLQLVTTYVPASVDVGSVLVARAGVKNEGTATGSGTVELLVNGQQRAVRAVALAPSESIEVDLELTPTIAGTFQVQFRLGSVTSGAWTVTATQRPTFVLSGVVIPSTAEVNVPMTVQATIQNPSSVDGWATVLLNVTGSLSESRDVYVPAGGSQAVSFTRTLRSLGDHHVELSLGSQRSAGFVRVARPEATFTIASLSVPQAVPGSRYDVGVVVANEGRASGTATVDLLVDGVVAGSVSRFLKAGESASLTFDLVAPTTRGSYAVEVVVGSARLGGTLTVAGTPTPVIPTRAQLRDANGAALAGATAILLGAGPDGALVARGTVSTDSSGQLPLAATTGGTATHVAIPDGDGFLVLPIPSTGGLTLPPGVRVAGEAYDEAGRATLATRFQDARVFTVGGASRRVTVGYAGVESVDVETTSSDARLVVARYGDKPLASIPSPPGTAYRWFDLHLSRPDGSDPTLTKATVRFTRPVGAEGALVLYHYSSATGAWETLDVTEDASGAFTATVDGFSLFAIGAQAPSALAAPWVLPTLAAVGLVAALGIGAVIIPRMRKGRAAAQAAAVAAASARPPEDLRPIVAAPTPPPPPPLVRRAAPRRPLAGDVQLMHVGVRTGGKTFLEDVSFRAPRGAITAIVGAPGAGKAMTLLALLGEAPYVGSIDVGGMRPDEDHADLKRSVGASAAGAKLDPDRTVEDIFDAIADKRALPRVDARMRGERVLSLLGSSATGATRVGDLAVPDERRVLIAAALVHEPELLLLDEPTLDLPPTERASLWSGIRRVREDLGLTILATTRYADDAQACDGVVILEQGKVVAKGAPGAVAEHLRQVHGE